MNFKALETDAKLRGGYYTPRAVAEFLSRFVLSDDVRSVLEPSCGDGVFIDTIGALSRRNTEIIGVEIDPFEAEKARQKGRKAGKATAHIIHDDFLAWAKGKEVPGGGRLAETQALQTAIGRTSGDLEAAELLLRWVVDTSEDDDATTPNITFKFSRVDAFHHFFYTVAGTVKQTATFTGKGCTGEG